MGGEPLFDVSGHLNVGIFKDEPIEPYQGAAKRAAVLFGISTFLFSE